MRWISYFFLAYIALGLQAGVARAMEWRSAGPDLVLLAAIFIALNAPRDAALLGCFLLGAMQDLTSQGTIGLYAFSYGLVGLMVVAIRQAVYRRHPLTHLVLALIAGVVTAGVLAMHGWIRPPGPMFRTDAGQMIPAVRPAVMPLFYSAVYTAILAPLVIGVLERIKGVFQFQSARSRGMSSRER